MQASELGRYLQRTTSPPAYEFSTESLRDRVGHTQQAAWHYEGNTVLDSLRITWVLER